MTKDDVHVVGECSFQKFEGGFSAIHLANSTLVLRKTVKAGRHTLEQETQLSLTNRVTRLEVSQGHQTWYHSIR